MNKLAIIFIVFFIWIGESYSQSCSDCIRNTRGRRDVPAGKGQDFTGPTFIDPSCMYYVQFAVYPMCVKDPDRCERIRAPQGLGEVWLIEHPETYVRGQSTMGGIYLVKPFIKESDAIAYAKLYNKKGIESWYNPNLTSTRINVLKYAGL